MKTKSILLPVVVGLAGILSSCSTTEKTGAPITNALDSLKARYAPDQRVAIFNVAYAQQGSVTVAKGDVDNPKAKEDALATIHNILGGQVIDSIRVLPDPQLGEKRFGIVAMSVGNVRTSPRNPAELSSQVLMGTVVNLLKKQAGYYYIQMPDKYQGWLNENSMKVTTAADVEEWKAAPKVIATTYFTMVREQPSASALPIRDAVAGDLMKEVGSSGQWVAVELPDGKKGYIEKSNVENFDHWKKTRKLTAENIEKTAKMFLGIPYLWGGTSTKGMDCSGFTKTVYRLNGLELSRDADQQADGGEEVKAGENFESLRITHVGIYLEKLEFIHTPGGWVRFNSFDPAAPNYSESQRKSFVRARRYIGVAQIPEVATK
jgi:uncharacterized protein YgiM (DUF1202 family)